MKIISASDMKSNITMAEAINAAEEAYIKLATEKALMPIRTGTDFGEKNPTVLYKPSFTSDDKRVVVKLLSLVKERTENTLVTINGTVTVIDTDRNDILAVLDAAYLTALRTGASAGLATKLLAREDAKVVALFGAGAQAATHLKALMEVRKIEEVIVYDIYRSSIDKLIESFSDMTDVKFTVGESLDELKRADIISTVTTSFKPLFSAEHVKAGTHINAFGSFTPQMRELPNDIFPMARVFVDHKESCFSESGDVIDPQKLGLLNDTNYCGEIAQILLGNTIARESESDITIFKSVGIAVQDHTIASYIYDKSMADNFGLNANLN
ncbi:MAG: hypothetical protein R3Y22_01880 [Bacteroidales bacterium]